MLKQEAKLQQMLKHMLKDSDRIIDYSDIPTVQKGIFEYYKNVIWFLIIFPGIKLLLRHWNIIKWTMLKGISKIFIMSRGQNRLEQ